MPSAFDEACSLIETALTGTTRQQILADLSRSKDFRKALLRLRERMQTHTWDAGDTEIALGRYVRKFDSQTRQEGFHALNDWDGKADHVNEDIIPVDVLNYVMEKRGDGPADRTVLAILVDYYFMHLLSLLSLRIWDDGDANENLVRLNALLRKLQGPDGSGQRFATDAETLLLIATSHFELVERGYGRLLERVRGLNRVHQTNIALGHTSSMGSHLRFGFEATYARDTVSMRNDNVADYPWLCFAVTTVMREYVRMHDEGIQGTPRAAVAEALLNGLSPDARAFLGEAPPALSRCEIERAEFRDLFRRHQEQVLREFEPFRPTEQAYSPLSFFFNFAHNVLKGTVIDALLRGEAWDLTFNDMLTALPSGPRSQMKEQLANTLMGYARASPDKIRGRWMPVIVYDPRAGRRAFSIMLSKLKK